MITSTQVLDQMQTLINSLRPSPPPYNALSDRSVKVKPPLPPLGPAGSTFFDPTFGSTMMRVTDGAGASYHVPSNSNLAAWSADSKRCYVVGSGGGISVLNFDAKLLKMTPAASVYSQVEPEFSRVDADAIYTVGGPITRTIKKYSFSTNTYTDVVDLDSLGIPNLVEPRTYVGGIMTGGNPAKLMTFFGGYGQDHHYLAMWYPLDNPAGMKILNTQTLTYVQGGTSFPIPGVTAPFHLHSASIDLSGRYVLLGATSGDIAAGSAYITVWDTTLNTLTPVISHPGGHGVSGFGIWVNEEQGSEGFPYDALQWQIRSLGQVGSTQSLITTPLTPKSVYVADHTNWNHAKPDNSNPLISSTYRYNLNTVPWRAWDDEIIGITPTPGGAVYRFCHHRSIVDDDVTPVNPYFWYQPIANVSPDGKWCIFTSNWEKTLGMDLQDAPHHRQDVFLVNLA